MTDGSKHLPPLTLHSRLPNWHIGRMINTEVLKPQRAEYGEETLATL